MRSMSNRDEEDFMAAPAAATATGRNPLQRRRQRFQKITTLIGEIIDDAFDDQVKSLHSELKQQREQVRRQKTQIVKQEETIRAQQEALQGQRDAQTRLLTELRAQQEQTLQLSEKLRRLEGTVKRNGQQLSSNIALQKDMSDLRSDMERRESEVTAALDIMKNTRAAEKRQHEVSTECMQQIGLLKDAYSSLETSLALKADAADLFRKPDKAEVNELLKQCTAAAKDNLVALRAESKLKVDHRDLKALSDKVNACCVGHAANQEALKEKADTTALVRMSENFIQRVDAIVSIKLLQEMKALKDEIKQVKAGNTHVAQLLDQKADASVKMVVSLSWSPTPHNAKWSPRGGHNCVALPSRSVGRSVRWFDDNYL